MELELCICLCTCSCAVATEKANNQSHCQVAVFMGVGQNTTWPESPQSIEANFIQTCDYIRACRPSCAVHCPPFQALAVAVGLSVQGTGVTLCLQLHHCTSIYARWIETKVRHVVMPKRVASGLQCADFSLYRSSREELIKGSALQTCRNMHPYCNYYRHQTFQSKVVHRFTPAPREAKFEL